MWNCGAYVAAPEGALKSFVAYLSTVLVKVACQKKSSSSKEIMIHQMPKEADVGMLLSSFDVNGSLQSQ